MGKVQELDDPGTHQVTIRQLLGGENEGRTIEVRGTSEEYSFGLPTDGEEGPGVSDLDPVTRNKV